MSKKALIIATGVVALIVIIAMYFIFRGSAQPAPPPVNSAPGTTTGTGSGIPDYLLDTPQENYVKILASNLLEEYNSYGYNDLSNLRIVASESDQLFAPQVETKIAKLEAAPVPGFTILTQADQSTFTYHYPDLNNVLAEFDAQVTEYQNNVATASYPVHGVVHLFRSGNDWLADDITITKK